MQLALQWAEKGLFITTPNPRVGCVIVKNNQVIGAGHTQPAGQAHAEVQALADAVQRGHDVRGATVYVTLEPCSHFGRTPPCADALIAARDRKSTRLNSSHSQISYAVFCLKKKKKTTKKKNYKLVK